MTFAVDDVEPRTEALPTQGAQECFSTLIGQPLLACSHQGGAYLAQVTVHPLVACVHQAYSDHRPLILSPDVLWLVILQGVAQHVALDPERYRSRLVTHDGRRTIVVVRDDIIRGSPDNPWSEVVADFLRQLSANLPILPALVATFSTTGPIERAAQAIVVMEVLAPYHEYVLQCVCGVPEVSLAGTAEDWALLQAQVAALPEVGLEWWLWRVRTIVEHCARAAAGEIDRSHWQRIYKLREAYGGELANGWLMHLFPYLLHARTKLPTVKNPLLHDPDCGGVSAKDLPLGASSVPLLVQDRSVSYQLALVSGVLAVEPRGVALAPVIGWAVHELDPRLSAYHDALAPFSAELSLVSEAVSETDAPSGAPVALRVSIRLKAEARTVVAYAPFGSTK